VTEFFKQHFKSARPHLSNGDEITDEEIPVLVDQSVTFVMDQVQENAGNGESYMRRLCTAVEVIIRAYR
jgi:hypothetical protein